MFGDLFRNDKRVGAGGYEGVTLLFTPGPDPAGEPEAITDQRLATPMIVARPSLLRLAPP